VANHFIFIAVITLVLAVPVGGIYVRWRTNYKPKVVQLEGTDVNERKVSNVFQMTAKVYRVEVSFQKSVTSVNLNLVHTGLGRFLQRTQ